jgi:hypothetical protein
MLGTEQREAGGGGEREGRLRGFSGARLLTLTLLAREKVLDDMVALFLACSGPGALEGVWRIVQFAWR